MNLDDELRRRMQAAADQAGASANPGAVAQSVATKAAAGPRPSLRLLGGLGAAGVIAGSVIGFTALKPAESAGASAMIVQTQQYSLYDCPNGGLRGTARPGDRVFVTGRDESGEWLELRDPRNQSTRAWVPVDAVDPDAVADVPVVPCNPAVELLAGEAATTSTSSTVPETTTTTPETTSTVASTTVPPTVPVTTKPTVPVTTRPTVAVTAPPTIPPTVPTTVPPTGPPTVPPTVPPTTLPADTQKPTVGQGAASPSKVYDSSWSANCASTSIITVTATDNAAVASVQGTWSGVAGSPKQFTKGAGNSWTMTFGPFSGLAGSFNQAIQISIVARDAIGNQSTAAIVSVTVDGTCLI